MNQGLYPIKLYLKHLPNAIMMSLSLLMNVLMWGWLLWYIRPQSDLIFLHYNVLFGVDLIGHWYQVLTVPVMGLCIIVVNNVLGWFFFRKDKFIAYLLGAVVVISHVFLVLVAMLLVFINV
ncbi:MAG: hypothetical protein COU33_04435 [Candidatus Magasanikbacteria bacterium CG10_big_fil_rev_8_21_14_0_10_43_6]|uniref:Uncharacterized protein n=1 Tax=Candidatus Magasanikbacteria bacterium CG10_big_fil_rev_8_21_14_0_10_43_6 TaxID=1974650 RepID=A0A2M6W092_9BACT|nr:MAG: hypothetical protein COU33_04435 [Candidatus Magasanikbacteria bacterium CG10_big_fil_rev_8_21_14_0_10_43_6]